MPPKKTNREKTFQLRAQKAMESGDMELMAEQEGLINKSMVERGAIPKDQLRVQKQMSGSVSANQLKEGAPVAPVSEVAQPDIPAAAGQRVQNVLGSIRSESENASRLAEEQSAFQSFADESSGFDIQNEQLKRFGVTPGILKRREEIALQLNDANTESALTQSRIAGKAGQTINEAGRSITQEQKENAIRNSSLAAEAAVLQGSIETGRALAKDAVNIAMQDRTFQANAQLQAISDLKDVVNEETRQLLEKEERKYNEELTEIKRVTDAVDNAMISGVATPEEVQTMTDPSSTDQQRFQAAQGAVVRRATQDYNLEKGIQSRRYELLGLDIESANQKIIAANEAVESGTLTPEQFTAATDLRKEVNGLAEVKAAKDLEPNVAALISSLGQETGVGDIAAINAFQRIAVDPGVAVREGDVALLQSAQSFTDQAALKAKGLMVGEKLTPEARQQMLDVASKVYQFRVTSVDENTQPIRTMAQEQGIDYGKYIGKNFASFEDLQSRVKPTDSVEWGLTQDTDVYLDDFMNSMTNDPSANPFGVDLTANQ